MRMSESVVLEGVTRRRLRAEFFAFFVAAPLIMAVAVPPRMVFTALGGLAACGILLLVATPGFSWRGLLRGGLSLGVVVLVVVGTFAVGYAVIELFAPGRAFALARANPELLAMIALLYPFLSALPQEIVYRALFFRRYGALLPDHSAFAVTLNAALFSLAHLMYWSVIVAGLTFVGGVIFAWSYHVRGRFLEAVVAHSAAGIVVFALGLGMFFYSGNVTRPF